jgi:ATP/maltotriose-dependent transcriptional regulator MalT
LHEAAALAARHGASELAVLAAIGLSIDDQMRGDVDAALKRVREALTLAEKVASPLNYAQLCLRIAELAIEAGELASAQAMLNEAQQDLIEGTSGWTYLTLLQAHASLALRDFSTAKHHAERAIAAASAQQNDRVQGVALRALAESYIGLNARSAAVQAIEDAIEKLERCGYPRALASAYRIAANLTGRAKYARAADDLAQSLESA